MESDLENSGAPNSLRMAWWHGFLFFAMAMAMQLALSVAIVTAIRLSGARDQTASSTASALFSPSLLALQVTVTCAMLSGFALFVPRVLRLAPGSLLKLGPSRPAVLALSALGILAVGFLSDEAVFLLHQAMPERFDLTNLAGFGAVFASSSPAAFALLTLVVTIAPGIGEELFFRGLLLRSFEKTMPGWLAVLVSSMLFGLLHLDPLQGFGATLIGLFLGFVAIASGSIWPAVFAHGFNNLVCSLSARYAEQLSQDAWEQGHPPEILIPALVIAAGCAYAIWRLTDGVRRSSS